MWQRAIDKVGHVNRGLQSTRKPSWFVNWKEGPISCCETWAQDLSVQGLALCFVTLNCKHPAYRTECFCCLQTLRDGKCGSGHSVLFSACVRRHAHMHACPHACMHTQVEDLDALLWSSSQPSSLYFHRKHLRTVPVRWRLCQGRLRTFSL